MTGLLASAAVNGVGRRSPATPAKALLVAVANCNAAGNVRPPAAAAAAALAEDRALLTISAALWKTTI